MNIVIQNLQEKLDWLDMELRITERDATPNQASIKQINREMRQYKRALRILQKAVKPNGKTKRVQP